MNERTDYDRQYRLVRDGLIKLAQLSQRKWRQRDRRSQIRDLLEERARILTDDYIEAHVDPTGHRIEVPREDSRFTFVLPPLSHKRNVIVCMSVVWDFTKDEGQGHFRLFYLNDADVKVPLEPFVIRFDHKERDGSWTFSHAQISELLRPYSDLMTRNDEQLGFLPTEIPRIPLASKGEQITSLLVCVLASIYGTENKIFRDVCGELRGDSDSQQLMESLQGRG